MLATTAVQAQVKMRCLTEGRLHQSVGEAPLPVGGDVPGRRALRFRASTAPAEQQEMSLAAASDSRASTAPAEQQEMSLAAASDSRRGQHGAGTARVVQGHYAVGQSTFAGWTGQHRDSPLGCPSACTLLSIPIDAREVRRGFSRGCSKRQHQHCQL